MTREPVGETTNALAISRRGLLKAGGALVVSFAMPSSDAVPTRAFGEVSPRRLDSWIAIHENGTVTAFTGRIDMGTGVETVYAQAVAEELEVPIGAIRIVMGDTARTPEQGRSTASHSVLFNLPPMRQAAAEARLILFERAAARLAVPVDQLTVTDGIVSVRADPARSINYGALIGGKRFDVTVDTTGSSVTTQLKGRAKLKDPTQFKVLGTSTPRVDIPAKVAGSFTYVHDVKLDGMLHGVVVLPLAIGAKLKSVDGFPRPIPGVVKVVVKGDFVGIVARTEQAAVQARKELKLTWSTVEGPGFDDILEVLRQAPRASDKVEFEQGDAKSALATAATVVENTYHIPFNSHGMMGPSCAVAHWRPDSLTIWSGTQWPDGTRRDVAAMMGMAVENVRVIWVEAAGSYGRLVADDAAADAALLSKAVGRPVRVQWQRGDEHAWSPVSAGAVISARAGLDAHGKLIAWDYEDWTSSHATAEQGNLLAWRLAGGHPGNLRLTGGAAKPSYACPNVKLLTHYSQEIARAVYMRSVGGLQNVFAIESMMDELACKAGADPIAWRMSHLADERMKAVLAAVAAKAHWQEGTSQKLDAPTGWVAGRGVALMGTADIWAYVAGIADVEVNTSTGEIYVRRVYVGIDAGRVANPDGLRNQVEGGTIMGISRALKEEVTFAGRSITTTDWASYPVLRFSEVPEVLEIVVLDTPNTPIGVGEPPHVLPPAAIVNAIFAATGVRVRSLPLRPDKLKKIFGST